MVAHLEGMYHALRVSQVARSIIVGVEQPELGHKRVEAFGMQAVVEQLSRLGLHGGYVVDAATHCIDIEH